MFFRQGIDIVENKRIEKLLEKYKDKFKKKILSNDEILHINKIRSQKRKIQKISSRFAAKEATSKALCTGMRFGLNFKDIEIFYSEVGVPSLQVNEKCVKKILPKYYRKIHFNLTISNEENFTVALVTIISK